MKPAPHPVDSLLSLRLAKPQDDSFLFQVYASTRAEEMALVGWNSQQAQAFLGMQFRAQSVHYRDYFPSARHWVIQRSGADIGRLILNESSGEILLIDITLLPEHRQAGTGTAILRSLQHHAQQTSRSVHLHVENSNPAIRLYHRLGFVESGQSGIYLEMIWKG